MLDRRSSLAVDAPAESRAPRVLLADDDALSRRLLGSALEKSGFEVQVAANGEETLRLIESGEPDVLVLDFEMPDLNGAEVCQRLRRAEREEVRTLPVIMLTAHAGEAEEIRCLQAGANDFVTKPVSREVLAARILTQTRLRALSDELRRHNEELARWRVAQEADLAAARATQQAIIPATVPVLPGWAVQTVYQPVIQVGGDVFGWRPLEHGRWLFWLADATGHGAAAALFTALAAQLFHQACETETAPAGILQAVNRSFRGVFKGRSFMTGCCAVLEPAGGLQFCSAGHPPLLVRRAAGAVESCGPHGTMLGLQKEGPLEQSDLTLGPGDTALLYTDGLFALKRPDGERFTHHALPLALAKIAAGPDFLLRLAEALREISDGEPGDDDIAAVALLKS